MTDPKPAEATVTIASQSIELALTGQPDVKNKWGAGSIRPVFVVFTYLPEGIRAHLYGVWVREDGELTDAPCDKEYRIGDTDEWPGWMSELAIEHKPSGRAAVLREAADEVAKLCEKTDINIAEYQRYDFRQRIALRDAEGELRRMAVSAQRPKGA
jgi:hypothetical protein